MWEPPVLWNFESRTIFLYPFALILSPKLVNLLGEKIKKMNKGKKYNFSTFLGKKILNNYLQHLNKIT